VTDSDLDVLLSLHDIDEASLLFAVSTVMNAAKFDDGQRL
jgi:hypothetical protein